MRIVLENICLVSVNAFVLISGFFGIRLSKEKLFKYVFQVFFFATIIMIIAFLFLGKQMTLKEELKHYYSYLSFNWFVVGYFALMLLSPMVNSYFENNTKKVGILVSFFFVDCVLGFLLPSVKCIGSLNGYSLIHLLFIYSLGRFMSVNELIIVRYRTGILLLAFIALVLFNSVLSLLCYSYSLSMWFPIAYNNPIVVAGSVLFFLVFYNAPIKQNRTINIIATSAFSAFLLQTNTILYPFFKEVNIRIYDNYSGPFMLCLFVGVIVTIYAGALLIDQIQIKCRQLVLNHIINKCN